MIRTKQAQVLFVGYTWHLTGPSAVNKIKAVIVLIMKYMLTKRNGHLPVVFWLSAFNRLSSSLCSDGGAGVKSSADCCDWSSAINKSINRSNECVVTITSFPAKKYSCHMTWIKPGLSHQITLAMKELHSQSNVSITSIKLKLFYFQSQWCHS